jgi:hypothetical protein
MKFVTTKWTLLGCVQHATREFQEMPMLYFSTLPTPLPRSCIFYHYHPFVNTGRRFDHSRERHHVIVKKAPILISIVVITLIISLLRCRTFRFFYLRVPTVWWVAEHGINPNPFLSQTSDLMRREEHAAAFFRYSDFTSKLHMGW